jgi:methylated-DNA-protein-cysteine methyltransferase related protein
MDGVGFEASVVEVLVRLRPGEVVSYGEVATEAGFPGSARAVGNLLARGVAEVPWWRVVRTDGAVVSRHPAEQIARLAGEGVTVVEGHVRPWRRAAPGLAQSGSWQSQSAQSGSWQSGSGPSGSWQSQSAQLGSAQSGSGPSGSARSGRGRAAPGRAILGAGRQPAE